MRTKLLENSFQILPKTIFSFVILGAVLASFYFAPTKALAQLTVPVGEVPLAPAITNTSVQATAATEKEYILDGILKASMQVVISNITNSIVTWINSGFQGNPAFISDPESFFTDVGDQIAGNFIAGTELGFVCEPFSLDIRAALAINYSSTYAQRNYCRLTDAIKNTENFTKFTNGDFSQGGWDSWFSISQNPQNNPVGAYLAAETELSIRTARGQSLKLLEANWGQGFLSYRECVLSDPQTHECKEYSEIQTPGTVIEKQLENTLGTGIRQLELADEINEIVGALVGQLAQTVLTEGLSSFGSGGSNYGSLRTTQAPQLQASCYPDKPTAVVGELVTWNAYVFGGAGGSTTYLWSGNDVQPGITTSTLLVGYTEPGRKTAAVRVTRGGQNTFQTCSSAVDVE